MEDKIIASLPWWQEEEENHVCHDCALDEVADNLVTLAHAFLSDEGQPADREHINEALLRAAMQANWITDEKVKELDDLFAKHGKEFGAG
jgi:hypothetical protein